MSIKKIALAAAAVAMTAGAASANTFGFQESVEDRNSIELDLVTAGADGVVEIYNLKAGEQGVLLGSAPVNAGANDDLRINIGNTVSTRVSIH